MVEVTAGRALWEKCREAVEPVRGGGQKISFAHLL